VKHLVQLEELALPAASDRILSELGRCCPRLMRLFFQVIFNNPKCLFKDIFSSFYMQKKAIFVLDCSIVRH
jgi:hypothetical protein